MRHPCGHATGRVAENLWARRPWLHAKTREPGRPAPPSIRGRPGAMTATKPQKPKRIRPRLGAFRGDVIRIGHTCKRCCRRRPIIRPVVPPAKKFHSPLDVWKLYGIVSEQKPYKEVQVSASRQPKLKARTTCRSPAECNALGFGICSGVRFFSGLTGLPSRKAFERKPHTLSGEYDGLHLRHLRFGPFRGSSPGLAIALALGHARSCRHLVAVSG